LSTLFCFKAQQFKAQRFKATMNMQFMRGFIAEYAEGIAKKIFLCMIKLNELDKTERRSGS